MWVQQRKGTILRNIQHTRRLNDSASKQRKGTLLRNIQNIRRLNDSALLKRFLNYDCRENYFVLDEFKYLDYSLSISRLRA